MKTVELRRGLVIDDDIATQNLLRFALQDLHQVQLRICSSAREGLQAAAGFQADFLLLGVTMPEIDGPTTLAGLRQNELHRETPALFVTSLVAAEDLRYYESLGVAGVISKPFDPYKIGDRIIELLTIYQGMTTDPPLLSNELEVLQQAFSRELPQHLARIRAEFEHCRSEPVTRAHCARLWEMIDDLRNSACTYGNHKISNAARRIEQRVAGLVLSPERSALELVGIEKDLMSWTR